jgi:predicted ribonuclease toxin of YeeF-YezG toxin-antitoxin module
MAENNETKTCPKDCMKCHEVQRLYCAAFMSRTALERMDELMDRFEKLEDKVKDLVNADESVFNPLSDE